MIAEFPMGFVPRTAYTVFPLVLPRFSWKDRKAAVLHRIRGMYPGPVDDKFMAIAANGKQGKVLVFLFDQIWQKDPLVLSTLAIRRLCRTGKRYCVIAGPSWVEYLAVEDGSVVNSTVCNREEGERVLERAAALFGLEEEDGAEPAEIHDIEVFCADEDTFSIPDGTKYRVCRKGIKDALRGIPRTAYSCFPALLPERRRRRILAAVTVTALGIAAMVNLYRWYEMRKTDREQERSTQQRLAVIAAEREAAAERLAFLEAEWEQVISQPASVYEVLEILAACLSSGVRLEGATITGGTFQIEGTGMEVAGSLGKLERHPRVEKFEIKTIVWDGGLQRFTVNGTVTAALTGPEGIGDMAEQIAWYEGELTRLEEARGGVNNAVEAAGAVLELLRRRRCQINRLRYLNSEGGWTLEASVRTGSMNLVRLLAETDEPGYPLEVTSLWTGKRIEDVDAVIVFFAAGLGADGLRASWGYEDHPKPEQIALLYGSGNGDAPAPAALPAAALPVLPEPPRASAVRPSMLEYVGFIGTVDGEMHVYVRDTRSGELYRLTAGRGNYGYQQEDGGVISAVIDGTVYQVRRNDGF